MPPEEADRAYLWDMLSYTRGIVRGTADKSWEGYRADENLRLAVERRVEIIGEAASHVSPRWGADRRCSFRHRTHSRWCTLGFLA